MVGIWLLIPKHLRIGTWELLCGWTNKPIPAGQTTSGPSTGTQGSPVRYRYTPGTLFESNLSSWKWGKALNWPMDYHL